MSETIVTVIDASFATHYSYYNSAMSEREEQAACDWKLSEADESSGCVVDGTISKLSTQGKSQAHGFDH
jgi:hypothetical protein